MAALTSLFAIFCLVTYGQTDNGCNTAYEYCDCGQWCHHLFPDIDPQLLRDSYNMAAGHYNGSIYLLYVLRLCRLHAVYAVCTNTKNNRIISFVLHCSAVE